MIVGASSEIFFSYEADVPDRKTFAAFLVELADDLAIGLRNGFARTWRHIWG
jgi:hypothetical protein